MAKESQENMKIWSSNSSAIELKEPQVDKEKRTKFSDTGRNPQKERHAPKRYTLNALKRTTHDGESQIIDAINDDDGQEWQNAATEELDGLERMRCRDSVPSASGEPVLHTKYIFPQKEMLTETYAGKTQD